MDATHPTGQTLNFYGLGKLDDATAAAVHTHLEQCIDCRRRVAEMSSDSFLVRIRDAEARVRAQSLMGATPAWDDKKVAVPIPDETLPPGLFDHPDYRGQEGTRKGRHGRRLSGPQHY